MAVSKAKATVEALAPLAKKINASHQKYLTSVRTSLEHARDTGLLLIEARDKLKAAGQSWGRWVQENCKFTISMAQRYVRIADHYHKLVEEGVDVAALSLTAALKLVADKPKGEKGGGGSVRAATGPFKVPSQEKLASLTYKAAEAELPDGSAEKKFVEEKAAAIARQVLAAARKSKLAAEGGQPRPKDEVAVALLVHLKKALDVRLVVAVEEEGPQAGEPSAVPPGGATPPSRIDDALAGVNGAAAVA
jgi:hypothetical protein